MNRFQKYREIVEQQDDNLEKRYREALSRGDYAEADRIAGAGSQTYKGATTPIKNPTDQPNAVNNRAALNAIRKNLELAGFTQQQIDSIVDGLGFQMGGLVPPEKGPMSQGVGSLFQER